MTEHVTIPKAEYARLVALAEDAEDMHAVARYRERLASGEEEAVPAAIVARLLDGESPIKVWREHRELSQSALARLAGVNRVSLADIEAGRATGSVATVRKLADALGVAIDDLV